MTLTCADLVRLHAEAVAADRVAAENATPATLDAALAAHAALDAAREVVHRRDYPRAGRLVAAFGEVLTVSPSGRKVTLVYSEPTAART